MTLPAVPLHLTVADRDRAELERHILAELAEIRACLEEIRKKGGWGTVTLTLKGGELTDIDVSVTIKRKLKTGV